MHERSPHTPEISPGMPEPAAELTPPSAVELVKTVLGASRVARVSIDRSEKDEAQITALTAGMEFWTLPPAVRRPGADYLRDLRNEFPDNPNIIHSLQTIHSARVLLQEHRQHHSHKR